MDSSMANLFVPEGLMRVEKLLCALTLVAFSTTSCFQMGNTSLGTVKTNSQMGVKSTAVSETKSIAVMDPSSTSDQRLTTSQDSPIGGSNVVMSPGTLGIAASLVLEQGANFGDTSVASEIGLAGDVTIQGTSAGLIIRPTEAVSLKKPLTISMPLPSGLGLHLAETNHYLIFYKSFDPVTGELLTGTKAVDGVTAKLVFDTSTNRDSVSFEGYFGAYWVAKVSREVKKEELAPAKLSTEPVININRVAVIDQKGIVSEASVAATQAVPEVSWGAIQSSFQAANRSLKVTESIASGRVLSLCKVDISEDKTLAKFTTNEAASNLIFEYAISKRSAHDLYARFRCNDDLGRFTVSPWTTANSIPAATPSAPKDVAFTGPASADFSSTVKWSNDNSIGFVEHRVKLCANVNCSTACGEEVSAKAPPLSLKGVSGSALYACVKSIESSGLVSALVASTDSLQFPNSGVGTAPPAASSPPTVTQVYSTLAAGSYSASAVIPIIVTFSEPVVVSGTLASIALAVTPAATASYVSGSGTNSLTFNYTVTTGQSAARLEYQSPNALTLNAATTIKNIGGLNADLTLPFPGGINSLGVTSNIAIVIPNNLPVLLSNYGDLNLLVGNPLAAIDVNDMNTGNDNDIDGDPLSYSCSFSMTSGGGTYFSGANCSLLGGSYSLIPSTGVFNWTPAPGSVPISAKVAEYSIVISASDGRGGIASSSLGVKVLGPSDYHYAYTAGQSGAYQFDDSIIDYSGGFARLRAADQLDNDNSSFGFASGEATGITFTPNSIRLGATAACNGLIANCNKLTSLTANLASFRDYYPMDAASYSANGFSTITGATMISDSKVGSKALELSGSDYATIPGNLNGSFTVSFWIRAINGYADCSDFADGVGIISGRSSALMNHWGISICDGWIVAGTSSSIKSSVQINNNVWRLITFTRDASSGVIKLYLDGKLDGTLTATTNALTNSPVLNIGNHPTGGTIYQGQIDELALYTTVLPDASIQFQYDMQKTERSGFFLSQVMDSKASGSVWQNLDWKTMLPNGKQLPDYNLQIINETPSDYSALPTSSLMNSNIGLWHLNESVVGTAPGGKDFIDNSGSAAHAQLYGNASFTQERGRFRSSVKMTTGSYAKMQNTIFELGVSSLTVSAWVKYSDNIDSKIFGTGWITPSTGWALNTTQGKLMFSIGSTTQTAIGSSAIQTDNDYNDNVWHHVVGVLDRTANTMRIFVDGKAASITQNSIGTCGTVSGASLYIASCSMLNANSGQPAYLGGTSTSSSFAGAIDEIALWSRALTDAELKNLYLRGANRVKFQVKSCTTPNCADGILKGPENNDTSYYTELLNSTNPTNPLGLVKPTSPSLEFAAVGTNLPVNNRYFQYKVILESDDRNDLCNYGTNASCSPEVLSVHVGPDHYPTSGEINYTTAVPFYSLYNLSETFGPAGCPHGTRYVLSRDGVNWYTYPASNWELWNGTFVGATPVSGINTGAGMFGSQLGRDNFFIKAILASNGLSPCELDDLSLQFNRSF